jgi:hypothetical protein
MSDTRSCANCDPPGNDPFYCEIAAVLFKVFGDDEDERYCSHWSEDREKDAVL